MNWHLIVSDTEQCVYPAGKECLRVFSTHTSVNLGERVQKHACIYTLHHHISGVNLTCKSTLFVSRVLTYFVIIIQL